MDIVQQLYATPSFIVKQQSVLTESQGMPWIVPCVGAAIFGFNLTALGDTSLTYLSDSYREVSLSSKINIHSMFLTDACPADARRLSHCCSFCQKCFRYW